MKEYRLPEFKAAGVAKAQGQQQRSQHSNFAGRHRHIMQCVEHRLRRLERLDHARELEKLGRKYGVRLSSGARERLNGSHGSARLLS